MTDRKKLGRAVKHPLPIPDTGENNVWALLATPPKKRMEWRYTRETRKGKKGIQLMEGLADRTEHSRVADLGGRSCVHTRMEGADDLQERSDDLQGRG